MTVATKVQKQVKIIARIEIKKNGIVVYQVRSSNGTDIYQVTVVRGHVNNCSCPARKPCYHMVQLQAREDARLIERVDTMIAQAQSKIAESQDEIQPTTRIDKSGYWYYPQHLEDGEWLNCVDRDVRGVGTVRFLTEEQAQAYLDNDYAGAAARRAMAPLSREAYQDEFSPCTIPGMY